LFNTNIFDFTGKVFLIIVLLAWVRLSTRASRLLHKCHENIYCLRAKASGCCCLVSINVATGVSLDNIRLLPFPASDNTNFYATVSHKLNASVNKPNKARLPSLKPKQKEIPPLNGEVVYNLRKC